MSKYNIGDRVIHIGGNGIETRGVIAEVIKLDTVFKPAFMYRISSIPVVMIFEKSLVIDQLYYLQINRDRKLNELGI